MPIFELNDELIFPHPSLAEPDGILAIGGDLNPERLILAYSNGIFPWFSEEDPILWWSPDPRCVLYPEKFKASKSLFQSIRNKGFSFSVNKRFKEVISACATIKRKEQDGTWITDEMLQAYIKLHQLGYAHSIEVIANNQLIGGLYGVLVNNVLSGESMFHTVPDASKAAMLYLVEFCKLNNIKIIDCQQTTPHLLSLGAEEISRNEFLEFLK